MVVVKNKMAMAALSMVLSVGLGEIAKANAERAQRHFAAPWDNPRYSAGKRGSGPKRTKGAAALRRRGRKAGKRRSSQR